MKAAVQKINFGSDDGDITMYNFYGWKLNKQIKPLAEVRIHPKCW